MFEINGLMQKRCNTISLRMKFCLFYINTLSLRKNCRHFAEDIFKCTFLNEKVWISLKISLKFVPKVWMNSTPALVQIMDWCLPWMNHYLNQRWLVYWRIYVLFGLNELSHWYAVRKADHLTLLHGTWKVNFMFADDLAICRQGVLIN